jgi:hypothetical protein
MSCNAETLRIWIGNFRSRRAKPADIARHSLVPPADCSGRESRLLNRAQCISPLTQQHPGSPQTIKQHLAAIKMLFDYLVVSQIVPVNLAAPVKGPTHFVKRGKTPVLSVEGARTLLDSIPTDSLQGLRVSIAGKS